MKQQAVLILDDGWIDSERNTYQIITLNLIDVSMIIFSENNDIIIALKTPNDIFLKENATKRDYMQLISTWNQYLTHNNN